MAWRNNASEAQTKRDERETFKNIRLGDEVVRGKERFQSEGCDWCVKPERSNLRLNGGNLLLR